MNYEGALTSLESLTMLQIILSISNMHSSFISKLDCMAVDLVRPILRFQFSNFNSYDFSDFSDISDKRILLSLTHKTKLTESNKLL